MKIIDKVIEFFKFSKTDRKKEEKLTLFDTKKYERPGYTNYKKCPNCGIEVNTNEEIKDIFGLMNVGGHTYSQSWCRQCRKIQPQEKSLGKGSEEGGIFN